MGISEKYKQQIYAGVLGKMIGVYLGRPVEGWPYQSIQKRFGEIPYYINEELSLPLIVADDDLSGTFAFFRAMEDSGYDKNLSAAQIGKTWLNYIIENRSILWWGGMGNYTEHTAYLNLKRGIDAPQSGSMARNGPVLSQQIGAQIFMDAYAMMCPGDPEQANRLVRACASVSHDGVRPVFWARWKRRPLTKKSSTACLTAARGISGRISCVRWSMTCAPSVRQSMTGGRCGQCLTAGTAIICIPARAT